MNNNNKNNKNNNNKNNNNNNNNKNKNKNNRNKNNNKNMKKIELTSTSLIDGFESKFLRENNKTEMSPELSWTPVENAVSYALVCFDTDANNWVHWVIQYIPPDITHLPEMPVSRKKYVKLPDDAGTIVQGKNSWDLCGYDGPAPPPGSGVHHYHFYIYALDIGLDQRKKNNKNNNNIENCNVNKNVLNKSIKDHVIAMGNFMQTYER